MKKLLSILAALAGTANYAQELNIGVHINPTFTAPVMEKASVKSPGIWYKPMHIDISGGLNIQYLFKKVAIETGINFMTHTVTFQQSTDVRGTKVGNNGRENFGAWYKAFGNSYSIELPLQLNVLLHEHKKDIFYKVYGIAGMAYEVNTATGFSHSEYSSGTDNHIYYAKVLELKPEAGTTKEWVNIIAGFKLNTVIRNIGLIDYGLAYHLPLRDAGAYYLKGVSGDNSGERMYEGYYYPRLAYLNIKLAYYFMNIEQGKKKKYRRYV